MLAMTQLFRIKGHLLFRIGTNLLESDAKLFDAVTFDPIINDTSTTVAITIASVIPPATVIIPYLFFLGGRVRTSLL